MDWIELRSDTRTVPTLEMRKAILTSTYGDWTYNEDQTVKQLQAFTAKMFGKEDAAYVVSGVFGNQCSLLTASTAGMEVLVRDKGHVIRYENGSCGLISRLMTRTLDCPEGYITPEILKRVIKKTKSHQVPQAGVLILEFPTFEGIVPPMDQFIQCCQIAKAAGIHVHVDGARVFNGLAALKMDPAQLMKHVSSLTFCLSKGLCAPMGSLVIGDKNFITLFKHNRKMLGGVVRKPGVLANAALVALKTMPQQLGKDNEIAQLLSKKMVQLGWIELLVPVQTNMIFFKITDPDIKPPLLQAYLIQRGIQCEFASSGPNRFVIHHYIREEQVEKILSLLRQFRETQVKK